VSKTPALKSPVAVLKGVGPWIAKRLQKIGIEQIGDLLYLFPIRYEDRTEIKPLGELSPGQKVLVEGEVQLTEVVFRRRRTLLSRLADGTGSVTLRFFHFNKAQQEQLVRGACLRCFGDVRVGPTGLEMVHPEYKLISDGSDPPQNFLTPIYPTTEGIHQQRLRQLTDQALDIMKTTFPDDCLEGHLPEDWPTLVDSLRFLHRPPRDSVLEELFLGVHPCQRRVAFEELIAQRLARVQSRLNRVKENAFSLEDKSKFIAKLRAKLPYKLTDAQELAISEILADVAKEIPMHRLLQGDVGSGKTIVAVMAVLAAASSGCQSGFMAPTELLTEQHFNNLKRWLEPLGIEVVALTGSIIGAERLKILARIAEGHAHVVVGTHALFQQAVEFKNLALMIVDEQHRFGVGQRLELKRKGKKGILAPHQLIMTATPIPRTLAMTLYADLECTVIDELPPGRQPVNTVVMPESRRLNLVKRIREHCTTGEQVYWVCPLIEESEIINSQAAVKLFQNLKKALPELKIELIHGRMKFNEKEKIMRQFRDGVLNLLVATTVIEVGVDVPNATLMVIENSERMGLSQLHQLRGRVGRGSSSSNCVLLFKSPISELAKERLGVMRKTSNGFIVAQKDLELRGAGDMFGTQQSGLIQLKVADLIRDADLLPRVIEISEILMRDYPKNADQLIKRWNKHTSEYAYV
tara:strand:+ start:2944 stop:5019 length:2076 start_codon:yes stop_codon:yes gene_type:complete